MSCDPCIFKLDKTSQSEFAENDEVFPGTQLGRIGKNSGSGHVLVVDGLVAVLIQPGLNEELAHFYHETWVKVRQSSSNNIVKLYDDWLNSLPEFDQKLHYEPISRSALQRFAATGALPANPIPPPPPTRPTTSLGGTRPPSTATVYGHLPFQDTTTAFDIFYRFEAWPSSRRVIIGPPGKIIPGTFASPSSELPYIPTGFAAVARNALPSFFPAVFRYELAPDPGSRVLCGAVVPMFGMSGGGVEVMFSGMADTPNRGAIANPAVILPY